MWGCWNHLMSLPCLTDGKEAIYLPSLVQHSKPLSTIKTLVQVHLEKCDHKAGDSWSSSTLRGHVVYEAQRSEEMPTKANSWLQKQCFSHYTTMPHKWLTFRMVKDRRQGGSNTTGGQEMFTTWHKVPVVCFWEGKTCGHQEAKPRGWDLTPQWTADLTYQPYQNTPAQTGTELTLPLWGHEQISLPKLCHLS